MEPYIPERKPTSHVEVESKCEPAASQMKTKGSSWLGTSCASATVSKGLGGWRQTARVEHFWSKEGFGFPDLLEELGPAPSALGWLARWGLSAGFSGGTDKSSKGTSIFSHSLLHELREPAWTSAPQSING